MHRVVVDLVEVHRTRRSSVRLVDKHTGGWGHINFDDFRFHAAEAEVPRAAEGEPPAPLDVYKHAGLKPEEAAKAMTVPEGFTVTLFAGEPDVHQPIAFCIDDRGRLWVVEAYVYPRRHPAPGPLLPEAERSNGDKIVIFEDTDGDGKFDKQHGLHGRAEPRLAASRSASAACGSAPRRTCCSSRTTTKTDKPAGEPQILLDGWGYEDTHETLNTFIWGPDGWLYGCHGVFTHSRRRQAGHAGRGAHADQRRHLALSPDEARLRGLRPRHHRTRGASTTTPTATSSSRPASSRTCGTSSRAAATSGRRASTSTRTPTTTSRRSPTTGTTSAPTRTAATTAPTRAGGGHAHCGLMCYQGGTWPKEYHGKLFMGNLHGHRINVDVLTPKGSGYVARPQPGLPADQRQVVEFHQLQVRPGRQRLPDRLVRQADLPPARSPRSGTAPTAASTRSATRTRSR